MTFILSQKKYAHIANNKKCTEQNNYIRECVLFYAADKKKNYR